MFTFVDHAYNASRSVFVYPCRREERERGESVIGFPWCVPLCVTRDDRRLFVLVLFLAVPPGSVVSFASTADSQQCQRPEDCGRPTASAKSTEFLSGTRRKSE